MSDLNRKSLDLAIIFIVILASFLYRRYDAFANPQLWAEGGAQVMQGWENLHFNSFLVIYAGYLMTVQRLIGAIFGILHISFYYIPLVYNLSTFLVTYLVAIGFYNSAAKLNIKHRISFATLFVLLPIGNELFMDEASLQWITGIYLINYIFTWDDKINERYYFLTLFLLFVFSTSGPYATILSPLILLLIFLNRKGLTIKRLLPLVIILIGGAIQFICIKIIAPGALGGRVAALDGVPADHFHLFALFTKNIGELLCLDNLSGISDNVKTISAAIIFILLVAFFIISYRRIETKRKYILLLSAILFFGSFIVTYWPKESKILSLEISRYYFLPYTCVGWLLIMAWDDKIKFIYMIVYMYLLSFHAKFLKTSLPDKKWKEQIKEYSEGKRDTIDINPDGWHVVLPKR